MSQREIQFSVELALKRKRTQNVNLEVSEKEEFKQGEEGDLDAALADAMRRKSEEFKRR